MTASVAGARAPRALLRVDASPAIGLGHLVRSLALADALVASGWTVSFACSELSSELGTTITERGHELLRVDATAGGAADALEVISHAADLTVVDGYGFGSQFYDALADQGCAHVAIDDNAEIPASARPNVVVNQNPHATAELYSSMGVQPLLLLGLDYALLRPEIRAARPIADVARPGTGVFLTIGGSDPLALTEPITNALVARDVAVSVAIGGAHPDPAALRRRLSGRRGLTWVDQEDFAAAFARSAVAVIGAGTSMWEAAHLGVPAVGIVVAENQARPAAAAASAGFLRLLEARAGLGPDSVSDVVTGLLGDDHVRTEMSARGRAAVDGRGAERVAQILTTRCATGW